MRLRCQSELCLVQNNELIKLLNQYVIKVHFIFYGLQYRTLTEQLLNSCSSDMSFAVGYFPRKIMNFVVHFFYLVTSVVKDIICRSAGLAS